MGKRPSLFPDRDHGWPVTGYLESVYKCPFPVMPDMIRHPEGFEITGFPLSLE